MSAGVRWCSMQLSEDGDVDLGEGNGSPLLLYWRIIALARIGRSEVAMPAIVSGTRRAQTCES